MFILNFDIEQYVQLKEKLSTMKKVQYVEMNEREHGLIGLGDIGYKYEYKDSKHTLEIDLKMLEKTIAYSGDKAKRIYHKIINDTHEDTINLVKRLACDSVGIPLVRIKEKSRKPPVVWARNFVFWYVVTFLSFSKTDAGKLFEKDHATVIYAIKNYKLESKHLKENELRWRNNFKQKLSHHQLYVHG